jgi:hypothetical protein
MERRKFTREFKLEAVRLIKDRFSAFKSSFSGPVRQTLSTARLQRLSNRKLARSSRATAGRNEVTWSNWVVQGAAAGAALRLGATSNGARVTKLWKSEGRLGDKTSGLHLFGFHSAMSSNRGGPFGDCRFCLTG